MIEMIQITNTTDKENVKRMFIDNTLDKCIIGVFEFEMEIKKVTDDVKIITFQVKFPGKEMVIGIFNYLEEMYKVIVKPHIEIMLKYYTETKCFKIKQSYLLSLYTEGKTLANCFGDYIEDSEFCKDCKDVINCMIVTKSKDI